MVSILEGELAAIVTDALTDANIPRDVTVTRTMPGDPYDPDDMGETVDYAGRGWIELYSDADRDGQVVGVTDVKVMILVTTIAVIPSQQDTITVGGETYQVITAARDASGALFIVQARR
ncbi:hypothetical protein [Aurantimonas sp. 22II-16-19i]|uniref:hypothetical protein n=1 Tax=Aurantimonas sp. 22II-16-19i TaxID=1317114 RepID=UPI0009F7F968|nr:hypothetical protein [Aurantimonas sp. 22II-16-19i]ORE88179.1 hypothetical protein ATO4_24262 [Aurantimonas sp. 22II-16-19i]